MCSIGITHLIIRVDALGVQQHLRGMRQTFAPQAAILALTL